MLNVNAYANPVVGIREKECGCGINFEIRAATPFTERGRHINGTKKELRRKSGIVSRANTLLKGQS
jgi:hypothetical protein